MVAKREAGESYADKVAARLIEQLQQGTAPWQRPWKPGELQRPYNPTTGKPYRGFNSVWLYAHGEADPRWMTYKQAEAVGAQVRKGEKGAVIQFYSRGNASSVKDEDGKPVLGPDGKPLKASYAHERPIIRSFVVFNARQIDGLPEREVDRVGVSPDRDARVEAVLEASGVRIDHVRGNNAYYAVTRDQIVLPERDQFPTSDNYYATALHELGHATGHPSRLSRDLGNPFGSEAYAKEELRAEIASLMLGETFQTGHDPGQHAAYVGSWIKVLRDDPREIIRAANDAERICEWVMDVERALSAERSASVAVVGVEDRDEAVAAVKLHQEGLPGLEVFCASAKVAWIEESGVSRVAFGGSELDLPDAEPAAALRAAHRALAERALQDAGASRIVDAGAPVAADVFTDYPDLAETYWHVIERVPSLLNALESANERRKDAADEKEFTRFQAELQALPPPHHVTREVFGENAVVEPLFKSPQHWAVHYGLETVVSSAYSPNEAIAEVHGSLVGNALSKAIRARESGDVVDDRDWPSVDALRCHPELSLRHAELATVNPDLHAAAYFDVDPVIAKLRTYIQGVHEAIVQAEAQGLTTSEKRAFVLDDYQARFGAPGESREEIARFVDPLIDERENGRPALERLKATLGRTVDGVKVSEAAPGTLAIQFERNEALQQQLAFELPDAVPDRARGGMLADVSAPGGFDRVARTVATLRQVHRSQAQDVPPAAGRAGRAVER